MALDATVAGANANAYGTEAEADAYFLNHPGFDAWTASLDQEQMLIHATRVLDQYDYLGTPATLTQSLQWPKSLGGVLQVETVTVVGTITLTGNATVIVTATGLTGSPITLSVPVVNTDPAATVATKIRTALNANSVIAAFFTIGGSSADVQLTRTATGTNDATMNISVNNGTCTGLTPALTAVNTMLGVAGNLIPINPLSTSPSGDLAGRYSTNAIPQRIKNAQFETALWLIQSGGSSVAAGTVSELDIGSSVKVKYATGSAGGFVDTSVDPSGLPIQAARFLKGLRLINVLA